MELEVRIKHFAFANSKPPLGPIEFDVKPGQRVAVVGPSACGKSTLLRIVAGLQPLGEHQGFIAYRTSERRVYNTHEVCSTPPATAFVFQEADRSLLKWRRVESNVRWVAGHGAGVCAPDKSVLTDALSAMELAGDRRAFAHTLSGGGKQRLALARAIAYQPQLLLLDEPLNSLDVFTRHRIEDSLRSHLVDRHITTIVVTHEPDEAIFLGNVVLLLSDPPCTVRKTLYVPPGLQRQDPVFQAHYQELYDAINRLTLDGLPLSTLES